MLKIYAIVAAVVLALLGVQEFRVRLAQGEVTELREQKEAARIAALTEKDDIEREWRRKYDDLDRAGEAYRKHQEGLVADAESSRDGMLNALDQYHKSRRACPPPGGKNVPADDPIGVFARLLNGTDRLAGIYAKAANEWRAVAAACEARYEVILQNSSGQK